MPKLTALFDRRRDGFQHAKADAGLGAKVFEKHCAICHQMAARGPRSARSSTASARRGLDRLMEDILDPNRNVDQTLRVTNLALKNGQIVSGLLLREEGEVLIVADAQGKEVRVPKSSVEERSTSPLSPMPANLVDQIAEERLLQPDGVLALEATTPRRRTEPWHQKVDSIRRAGNRSFGPLELPPMLRPSVECT